MQARVIGKQVSLRRRAGAGRPVAASTLGHGADLPIVLMAVILALRAQHDVLLGQPLVEGGDVGDLFTLWRDRVVGRAPAACWQLAGRARRHLHGRPRLPVDSALRRRMAQSAGAHASRGSSGCHGRFCPLQALLRTAGPRMVTDSDIHVGSKLTAYRLLWTSNAGMTMVVETVFEG